MRYTAAYRYVKMDFLADVESKIEDQVQPSLDWGARQGWRLHTFSSSPAINGVNVLLIWETPDRNPA